MRDLVEPCPCIARIFIGDDTSGTKAYCDRHKLFALKAHSGRIVASTKPFPKGDAQRQVERVGFQGEQLQVRISR